MITHVFNLKKELKQQILTFITGLNGNAFTKNIAFSSLSLFGYMLASQAIFIFCWKLAGIKPQFGTILTGIGADVYT